MFQITILAMILPIQSYKCVVNKNIIFGNKEVTKISNDKEYNKNLKYRWQDTLSKLQIPQNIIDSEFDNFYNAYSDPKRHYHGLFHIEKILKEVDNFKIENPKIIQEPNLLDFAIFMHDIINSEENDVEKSANLACEILNQSDSVQIRNKKDLLYEIILATKHNKTFEDSCLEAKVIKDADLAILGANELVYDDYSQKIRKEYSEFDNETFTKGRIRVLDLFLSKPRIYSTAYFRNMYEIQARKNLMREKMNLK